MSTRTVRRTSVTLPALDEPGLHLSSVVSLESGRGRVAEFTYADAVLRELNIAEGQLLDGRVLRLRAQRTLLEDLRVDSVEFSGCELSSLRWSGGKLSRVAFSDCKIMGGAFEDVVFDNVLFDKCRLAYTTFSRVRAAGPVVFSECSLREATFSSCDLGAAAFDTCMMEKTEFDGGRYTGFDLRGNDLSAVRGVSSLRRMLIDRPQTLQLAQALAADLDVTFGEDLQD
ncbi:pentapeptide repeat-containing protein [Streptomyces sp. NPDC002536]